MVVFSYLWPACHLGEPDFHAWMREGGILLNFALPRLLTPNPDPKERQYGLEIKDPILLKDWGFLFFSPARWRGRELWGKWRYSFF